MPIENYGPTKQALTYKLWHALTNIHRTQRFAPSERKKQVSPRSFCSNLFQGEADETTDDPKKIKVRWAFLWIHEYICGNLKMIYVSQILHLYRNQLEFGLNSR